MARVVKVIKTEARSRAKWAGATDREADAFVEALGELGPKLRDTLDLLDAVELADLYRFWLAAYHFGAPPREPETAPARVKRSRNRGPKRKNRQPAAWWDRLSEVLALASGAMTNRDALHRIKFSSAARAARLIAGEVDQRAKAEGSSDA